MKTKLSLIGVLASLLLGACSKSIVLNDYVIVKPAAATATEAKAASELQKYLFEISGLNCLSFPTPHRRPTGRY